MSIRENILANLKTSLAAITAGSTYTSTVAEVSRRLQHWEQFPSFPVLIIWEEGVERLTEALDGYYESVLTANIIGFVKPPDEVEPSTRMNELITDVRKCLLTDPSRGGYADWTRITEIDSEPGQPVSMFRFGIEIEYHYHKATP